MIIITILHHREVSDMGASLFTLIILPMKEEKNNVICRI